jgi:hypothetical protein
LRAGVPPLLAAFLSACMAAPPAAAPPPAEAARMGTLAANEAPAIDACWRSVLASAPHRALRSRTGDHADSPSAAQKASADRASADEIAWLGVLQRDHVEPCRRLALAAAAQAHPTVAAILRESYAQADANAARLKSGSISWGEYVSESQAIVTRRRGELRGKPCSARRPARRRHAEPADRYSLTP